MLRPPPRALPLTLLLLLALSLRLLPAGHGLPRTYVPDAHMVRNALGMARDRDPVPPVGRYSSYPYLVPYLLLPVYAAEYAAGRAAGAWSGSGEFGMRAMEDPGLVTWPARALMALLGALSAWVVFRAARAAGLAQGAWIAAWLTATSLLNVQLSTHERPWVAVVFFGALSLWAAIAHARSGRAAHLLWAGAAAGLAFASHQAGLVFLGLPATAWLTSPAGWSGRDLGRRLAAGTACVALFLLVGLFLGHAYYLKHGSVPTSAVSGGELAGGELASEELSIGGQAVDLGFSPRSLRRLSVTFFGYDPVLVVLGVAGFALFLRRRETRGAALFTLACGAFFLANPSDHARYLLPVAMLLALPAGMVGERLLAARAGHVALAFALALPLVQALRFDLLLLRGDTRERAERALAELPPGSLVAIDHYGPQVDLSEEALKRVRRLRGELRAREAHRLALLEAGVTPPRGAGVDALFVEELFEVDLESGDYAVRPALRVLGDDPAAVLSALGVTHLLLVDRRPGDGEPRPLAQLVARGAPLAVIDPAGAEGPPQEAFLPTEMDFPLTALWQVERAGPWMALHALAR